MRAAVLTTRRARRFVISNHLRDSLARIFGVSREHIDRIKVIEHSRFARLHGPHVAATTRRNAIYLSGSGDAFVSEVELVLHEYFHVVRQWNSGSLTVWRYLRESVRHGYAANRYEVAAREFARRCLSSDVRLTDEQDNVHLRTPALSISTPIAVDSAPTSKEKS